MSRRETDIVAADGRARIFEPGYRPYRGVRLGVSHSIWALARHTAERMLGLKRPARYKVLPFASVIIAYLPALAFIGILALIPNGRLRLPNLIPGPGRHYGFITAAIGRTNAEAIAMRIENRVKKSSRNAGMSQSMAPSRIHHISPKR